MAFITLTQFGSDRKVAIAVDAIGYFSQTPTGSTWIYVGGGEEGRLVVAESFETIMDWLKEAGEAY